MRNPVRKFVGVAVFSMLAVFVAAPSMAGAQTTTTTPGPCNYNVTPNPITVVPSTVTIAGTAPVGVTVQLFVNSAGTPTSTQVVPAGGAFSFSLNVTADTTDVSLNYTYGPGNAYTAGCTNVAGEVVTRITKTAPTVLAQTGSSNTTTYVLIGFGAVAVGLVLVVAARRRARVHS